VAKMLYLSYDGDNCGKKVGRAILANDEKALHEISAKIDLGHEIVNHWVAEHGGKRISGGGDEGSFKIPEETAGEIESLRKDYHYATGITMSVGIGNNLSEAGRALLAAKFRGKDQVAHFDENVEKDIKKARQRVKKGKASQDEVKLAEAYLEKAEAPMEKENEKKPEEALEQAPQEGAIHESECPYCEATDGVDPDHCKYCHDADTAAGHDDCPYCKRTEVTGDDCPYCKQMGETAGDDCPYCKRPGGEAVGAAAPADLSAPGAAAALEAEACKQNDLNPPGIGKPDPIREVPIEAAPSNARALPEMPQKPDPAAPSGDGPMAGIDPEDNHSTDALKAIASQIEAEGNPPASEVNAIDTTETVEGSNMEGTTSRPEGYAQNVPSDMGLGQANSPEGAIEGQSQEDSNPDLTSVLQDGLQQEASSIQKDRAVQMVSSALQGFKANKQYLEQAKQAAPQLYQSTIMMLKAMIEMAKALGLGGGVEGSPSPLDAAAAGQQTVAGGNEWDDPFPTHPDQGGAQKPGHHAAGQEAAAKAPQR